MKGFERFSRGGATGAFLSIQPTGILRLSAALVEALGNPTHIVLLSDRQTNRIAVQAVDSADPDAYKLIEHPRSRAATVSAVTFLKGLGVDPRAAARRYPATLPEPGTAVFQLPETPGVLS